MSSIPDDVARFGLLASENFDAAVISSSIAPEKIQQSGMHKLFVAAMEDVLEVYHLPYNPDYPVVCMDESSKQLIGEVHTPILGKPGQQNPATWRMVALADTN